MRADLEPVETKECEKMYSKSVGPIAITGQQVCGRGIETSSTCGGDSGGPSQVVTAINKKPRFVQYGIISFRTVFCSNDVPIVFTKVSEYMDWILTNIKP